MSLYFSPAADAGSSPQREGGKEVFSKISNTAQEKWFGCYFEKNKLLHVHAGIVAHFMIHTEANWKSE